MKWLLLFWSCKFLFPFQVPHLRLYYGWHKHINYINNGNLSNDSSTEERTLVVLDEMHPSNFKMPPQENITSLTSFLLGKDTFFITYLDIIYHVTMDGMRINQSKHRKTSQYLTRIWLKPKSRCMKGGRGVETIGIRYR